MTDTLGGILGLLVLCGVLIIVLLFCIQKRPIQRVAQRRQCEIHFKGAKRTDSHCNEVNASSSYLKNQQCSNSNVDLTENHDHLYSDIGAADTDENTAHNREDDDDNIYDDIVNVANLSKATLVKERERFNTADSSETIMDHGSEYSDYDDVIISTVANNQQPLGSLTTYNANPAYTTRQEYLTASVKPLPELTTYDSQSDLDDYENADEVNLSKELLINNDAYVKTDCDYLQLVPHHIVTSTSSNSHATAGRGSPHTNTGTSSSVTMSSDVHQPPKFRLVNEFQLSTVGHRNVISQSGAVVHEYDSIELQGNVPLLVSHQGQSTPLGKGTNPTLGNDMKHESNISEGKDATKFPNPLSNPLDHICDSADRMEKSGQTTSNVKEIGNTTDAIDTDQSTDDPDYTFDRLSPCVYVELRSKSSESNKVQGLIVDIKDTSDRDFDASTADDIDTDKSADDPDYTFDRLSPCVYMDPEQLHSKSMESNNIHRFVGDVSYSKISPVTHWQEKWSKEDLLRANAVYAKVNTLSKKPKPGTLDKKLGTLV